MLDSSTSTMSNVHTQFLQLRTNLCDLLSRLTECEGLLFVGFEKWLDYALKEAASCVFRLEDSDFGDGHREGVVVVDLIWSVSITIT